MSVLQSFLPRPRLCVVSKSCMSLHTSLVSHLSDTDVDDADGEDELHVSSDEDELAQQHEMVTQCT